MQEVAVQKTFTVASANQALPLVRSIVQDIVTLFAALKDLERRLEGMRRPARDGRSRLTPHEEEVEESFSQLDHGTEQFWAYLDELRSLGVELKDFELGLIDFPTLVDGQPSYLCWRLGEPQVEFWHTRDGGFQGRRPVAEIAVCCGTASLG